jgi:hypothetical protein
MERQKMFVLTDEDVEKLRTLRPRIEKILGREIPDDEDMVQTFVELVDKVESGKYEWKDSDLEQYD